MNTACSSTGKETLQRDSGREVGKLSWAIFFFHVQYTFRCWNVCLQVFVFCICLEQPYSAEEPVPMEEDREASVKEMAITHGFVSDAQVV